MPSKLTLLVAVVAAGLAITCAPAGADDVQSYTVSLTPMNGSNVGGGGTMVLDVNSDSLGMQYSVTGLDPAQPSNMTMRGLPDGESTCPTAAQADANGDGVVTLAEIQAWVGNVLAVLPSAPQGTAQLTPTSLLYPIRDRSVLILGGSVNGIYDPTLPVACGKINHSI
jgi:hypothetical protein